MGFFDRFKSIPPRGTDPPRTTVPEGHQVVLSQAASDPGVSRTVGGVVVANMGVAGDDPDRELDEVCRDVEAAVREGAAPSRIVNVNRELSISELFAPADPETLSFQSPVSWVFSHGSVEQTIAVPRRLQFLLRCMHRVSVVEAGRTQQAVYIVDPPSPRTLAFASLVAGLGVYVKQPDPQGTVLVEVKRPEGVTLCALAGAPYAEDIVGDPYARTVNEAKDRAANEGELLRLEEQERAALAERVGSADGLPPVGLRAPRLRQLILELEDGAGSERFDLVLGRDGMARLVAELLEREAPLFFMKNVQDDGMDVRNYGAAGPALPIFADRRCLAWAAQDMAKPDGSFVIGRIGSRALISMAAGGGMGLAICTFRDRKTPVYAILSAPLVKSIPLPSDSLGA